MVPSSTGRRAGSRSIAGVGFTLHAIPPADRRVPPPGYTGGRFIANPQTGLTPVPVLAL